MKSYSEIFEAYRRTLDKSHADWEKSVTERGKNAKEFNDDFFNNLTVIYGDKINESNFRSELIQKINEFFGKDELTFIAVDGSNDKHVSNEFISFYGGAYGSRGTLKLSSTPPEVEYKRWDFERDVSMVAFVPIPYSQLGQMREDQEETFYLKDDDRIDITNIHTPIMQLAEIFLAYNSAIVSHVDSPDILLIDNNISGIFGSTDFSPLDIDLVNYQLKPQKLTIAHAAIAQAHPINEELKIPDSRNGSSFNAGLALIRFFHSNPKITEISVSQLEKELEITGKFPRGRLETLDKEYGLIEWDELKGLIKPKVNFSEHWNYVKYFFQEVCRKIFIEKNEDALMFPREIDGQVTMRWMTPKDITFLISIGIRALIELCWEKNILLAGIAKDSYSRYLTKNYLGVCKLSGVYSKLSSNTYKPLPPTDRLFCEVLPYIDEKIAGPWGTIEFDSTFMTLHAEEDNSFKGTRGGITRPERLFLRSICQFFTLRKTESVLTGHAVFVDRLVYPKIDLKNSERLQVIGKEIGTVNALLYKDKNVQNIGQAITMFLLYILTKNIFPEAIGYPDPLRKADQGAKDMKDKISDLLKGSEIKFRSKPLINTLREIRESFRR